MFHPAETGWRSTDQGKLDAPARYGRSASTTAIDPSGQRWVSRYAATVRGHPIDEPFTVWQTAVALPGTRWRIAARRAW